MKEGRFVHVQPNQITNNIIGFREKKKQKIICETVVHGAPRPYSVIIGGAKETNK